MSRERKAVFLDRDGVICEEPPFYAHRPDQLKIISGVPEAIRILNENDFLVVVASNQAGVAKGLYTEDDTIMYHAALAGLLEKEGARIDKIYYCPHHPRAVRSELRVRCSCRKPEPGMLKKAAEEWSINLSRSFMVGDKWSDIGAGNHAGVTSILVRTGQGEQQLRDRSPYRADFILEDLPAAVRKIITCV